MICSDARTKADGRLVIDGVFNELFAPGFPARQEKIVIAGMVIWDAGETGRIAFRIELIDPMGASVFTVDGYTDVEISPNQETPPKTQLVLPLEKVVFNEPGRYRTQIDINGTRVTGPSLFVLRTHSG